MQSPFKVGQRYRNRDGSYVVVSIDGDKMKIRYQDGQVFEANLRDQTRIWERIQEEKEFGAEDLEVDGEGSGGEGRKTEEIKTFVAEVLRSLNPPWPPDITDQVCLQIERHPKWLTYYHKLEKEFGDLTLNSSIGMYTRDLTSMESTGRMGTAKSQLIKSYSILKPNQS